MNHQLISKDVHRQKLLFALPVIVLPFLTFICWCLGVVGETAVGPSVQNTQGFNFELPSALPGEDSAWNKLKFYEQADKDSEKIHSLIKNDPYAHSAITGNNIVPLVDSSSSPKSQYQSVYNPYPSNLAKLSDSNEAKVYKKLALLNEELRKTKDQTVPLGKHPEGQSGFPEPESTEQQLKQLQTIMQNSQNATGTDPEMQQIDGMLEKILDIQHPERAKIKIKQVSEVNSGKVYPVVVEDSNLKISVLQSGTEQRQIMPDKSSVLQTIPKSNFYALKEDESFSEKRNLIEAIVKQTQTVQDGGTVRLQLKTDIYVNGILIPMDNDVFGVGKLNGDRLEITIKSVRFENNILPVALTVFDLDGMEGINVPGAGSRDAVKQSADQAIQGIGLTGLEPSIGAQAASAGIQTAKSLLGKKARTIKVTIKNSYRVLLRDANL